jgi:hypothetical protein
VKNKATRNISAILMMIRVWIAAKITNGLKINTGLIRKEILLQTSISVNTKITATLTTV